MSRPTVVVHGASASQGAPVVRQLVAAGHRVHAVVRNRHAAMSPPEAHPAFANLLDEESLAAYAGVDAVVLQLPLVFDEDIAAAQADAVLGALRQTPVPRVVFNTGGVLAPEPIGIPHVDVRSKIAATLPQLVARAMVVSPARLYLENLSAPWSTHLVRAGELRYPLPEDEPVPGVAPDNLGAVVADLVTAQAPPAVRVVSGPEAPLCDEVAEELDVVLGREVQWRTIKPAEYARMLAPHLGSQAAAGIVRTVYLPPPLGARARAARYRVDRDRADLCAGLGDAAEVVISAERPCVDRRTGQGRSTRGLSRGEPDGLRPCSRRENDSLWRGFADRAEHRRRGGEPSSSRVWLREPLAGPPRSRRYRAGLRGEPVAHVDGHVGLRVDGVVRIGEEHHPAGFVLREERGCARRMFVPQQRTHQVGPVLGDVERDQSAGQRQHGESIARVHLPAHVPPVPERALLDGGCLGGFLHRQTPFLDASRARGDRRGRVVARVARMRAPAARELERRATTRGRAPGPGVGTLEPGAASVRRLSRA